MKIIRFVGFCAASMGIVAGCSSSSSSGDVDAAHPLDASDAGDQLDGSKDAAKHGDSAIQHDAHVKDVGAHEGGTHDAVVGPTVDGAHPKDAMVDGDLGSTDATHHDGSTLIDGAQVDAGPVGPARVLVTFGGASTSELVAVNVGTKAVDGRMQFGGSGITEGHNTTSPFLLEQTTDVVARLDSTDPWHVDSTWDVRLTDGTDGGPLAAMPNHVVVDTPTQAYVLRYQRNEIAVVNESTNGDGGAPTSTISLASLVQTGDSDGLVDMTAAAYVAATHRLYVVLGNINQELETTYGGVICGTQTGTIVAIDTTTNAIVDLGGTGPKGSIALTYSNPVIAVYDGANNRLLVVDGGCYPMPAAVGDALGAATKAGVEAVDLTSGKSTSLLALNPSNFGVGFDDTPTGFAYIDATHAIIGFDGTGQAVYSWNPTDTTLGSPIPNAPDVFAYDGNGHLVGTRMDTTDAGASSVTSTAVVSVAVANGASTTLATNVTTLTGVSYVSSVDIWPHP